MDEVRKPMPPRKLADKLESRVAKLGREHGDEEIFKALTEIRDIAQEELVVRAIAAGGSAALLRDENAEEQD